MDNNDNNQTQISTEAWLNSYAPPPPKPKKPIKSVMVLLAFGLALIVLSAVGFLLLNRSKSCLSTYDFKDLTGYSLDEQANAKEDFYTFNIGFIGASTDYKSDNSNDEVTTKKLSDFYSSHKNKSILININSSYPKDASADLANSRVEKVKNDLVSNNVPKSIIKINPPPSVDAENDDGPADSIITVSITSSSKCKQ